MEERTVEYHSEGKELMCEVIFSQKTNLLE
jgi:hypothetical protein